jgi:hypothetical protein
MPQALFEHFLPSLVPPPEGDEAVALPEIV